MQRFSLSPHVERIGSLIRPLADFALPSQAAAQVIVSRTVVSRTHSLLFAVFNSTFHSSIPFAWSVRRVVFRVFGVLVTNIFRELLC